MESTVEKKEDKKTEWFPLIRPKEVNPVPNKEKVHYYTHGIPSSVITTDLPLGSTEKNAADEFRALQSAFISKVFSSKIE